MIVISKNGLTLKFNEEIKMRNSFVCRAMLAVMPETNYSLTMVTTVYHHKTMDINQLHKKLRHTSENLMQKTATFYGWDLKILFDTCKSCALTKLQQKDTNKEKNV